jgi:hypothetical protein
MASKLFYGNYYMKQAKSYLADLIKTGWVSRIEAKELTRNVILHPDYQKVLDSRNFSKAKIIGCEMISRHSRSLNPSKNNAIVQNDENTFDCIRNYKRHYTLFVQYLPEINRSKSILCKSI